MQSALVAAPKLDEAVPLPKGKRTESSLQVAVSGSNPQ